MKQFIHIRGCMASGKTSTARSVMAQGNYVVKFISVGKKEYPYTIDEKKRWVITGRYDLCECGGVDGRIKGVDLMKNYLYNIMRQVNPDVLIFEAVMYGVTYKFATEINKLCESLGYKYLGIHLNPSFENVMENMNKRNGGKEIKFDNLSQMYFAGLTAADKLNAAGIKVVAENPREYSKEDLHQIVEKYVV